MLTKEQIRSTKESASADVKHWFTGHMAQTKIKWNPNPEAEEKGFVPDEDHRYMDKDGNMAKDENGRPYHMIGERVPMSIAEYIQERLGWHLSPNHKERLIKQFGYTEESLNEKLELYNESFWRCHALRQKNTDKHDKVIAGYADIFKEAEKIAAEVDLSDIRDGFPCGACHLYLKASMHDTDLGKALAFKNGDASTDAYKYQLSIKMPNPGQCISYTERICKVVEEFLNKKGVEVGVYSWID